MQVTIILIKANSRTLQQLISSPKVHIKQISLSNNKKSISVLASEQKNG
jgi:hypothetical protein